ncbi:hypothetical protein [Bacillus fonticola]|uniref:hypothetical protein n=1 Tax=Bacillus fonticola TaxID=2728853 RepID=UPI001D153D91|nr:hypothetical protein [Bacillus fonticola]
MSELKKYTKIGNIIFYVGLTLFAIGFALKNTDVPASYSNFSTPFIVAGFVFLIATNFFRKKRSIQKN